MSLSVRPSRPAIWRRLLTAAAAVTVAFGVTAGPAHADPVKVSFPVAGTATVKKQNTTLTLPNGGTLAGNFDLSTFALTGGTLSIPTFTAKIRLGGIAFLGDTTSTVKIVQTAATTANVQSDGTVKAVASLQLQLPRVSSDLLPSLNIVSSTCHTQTFQVTLTSSNKFSLSDALKMSGTYTIPSFSQCGFLRDQLLTSLLSGSGNQMNLTVGPISMTGGGTTAS